MGSKTSSQQNQASTTVADPQAYQDYDSTIRRAKQVSNTPYTAYSGQLTAPTNAQEATATTALNGLGAAANGYYNAAACQSGLGAAAVNASPVNAAAINSYMSPYNTDVVNSTAALLNQQDAIRQQQQTSSAIGAGAFGGDRAGVASAALAGQQDLANNSTLAGLENQNYLQALSEANTQQAVGLGAAQANRAAVQQNAATLAGIGSAATTSGLGVAGAQLGAGALQQQTQQASDTAQYGQFLQQEAYPFQTEQYLANIVEGIAPNYGSSTAGTSTTQTSPLNSIIGGAALAGGLAPSMSGLSTGLGNLASGLGNIFTASDRRVKEDIRQAGALFDGLPVYSFRYKGSPVTQLGLVAQDVEKKYPKAVKGLGAIKMVDYEAATRKASDKGHFAKGGRTLGEPFVHALTREEIAHLDGGEPKPRASGGVVGPYADGYVSRHARWCRAYTGAQGYVPTPSGLGASKMLTSSLPSAPQPTNPIPHFQQFQQASQGLGALGSGLGTVAGDLGSAANFLAKPINGVGTLNLATGGRANRYNCGLGAAAYANGGAARRHYDGGGVVGADDLVFDPNALGTPGMVQSGLGAVQLQPATMVPPVSPQGLGAASPPPQPAGYSQGLGAAQLPASNDNASSQGQPQGLGAALPTFAQGQGATLPPVQSTGAGLFPNGSPPVPVTPAPVTTPVVGYQQPDGTVTPTAGARAGGALPNLTPPGGVAGNAVSAIGNATAPRSVRNVCSLRIKRLPAGKGEEPMGQG